LDEFIEGCRIDCEQIVAPYDLPPLHEAEEEGGNQTSYNVKKVHVKMYLMDQENLDFIYMYSTCICTTNENVSLKYLVQYQPMEMSIQSTNSPCEGGILVLSLVQKNKLSIPHVCITQDFSH
jgi:hypothetical protein